MRRSASRTALLLAGLVAVVLFAGIRTNPAETGDARRHDAARWNSMRNSSGDAILGDAGPDLKSLRTPLSDAVDVSDFLHHSRAFARVRAAMFAMDVELASLDPRHVPYSPRVPPRHEADVGMPEPSSFQCRQMSDGFEVCEYQNVCADVPSPVRDPDGRYASSGDRVSQVQTLYFVGSDVVPSMTMKGSQWPQDRAAVAASAPGHCAAVVNVVLDELPWPAQKQPSDCLRWARHFVRLYPQGSVSIPFRVSRGWTAGFDSTWEDIPVLDAFRRERITPFSTPFDAAIIPANATLSVAHGGAYDGVVTWVDNLYVAHNILDAHLWGFSQAVATPLLSAYWANVSQAWNLPPLENLLILGTPAWKPDQLGLNDPWSPWAPWHMKNADKWALGLLRNTLEYVTGRVPWRGLAGPAGVTQDVPFSHLRELVRRLTAGQEPTPGQPVALPTALPFEWTFLSHPPGAGTRVIYSHADLPLASTAIGSRDSPHACSMCNLVVSFSLACSPLI